MNLKKRTKVSRMHGSHTHGRGFKKKARGSGHRGGVGMAGTGKRADQKKTLILNLPEKYFGKSKAWRKKLPVRLKVINLDSIKENKTDYKGYKILSRGSPLPGLKIKATAASKLAIEKVRKAGGQITLLSSNEESK